MYCRIIVVLNRVRVLNPQRLTNFKIMVEYPPPPLGISLRVLTNNADTSISVSRKNDARMRKQPTILDATTGFPAK